MAEFDYDLQPVNSFQVDPTKERWSMSLVETRVFSWVYWHRVLKGCLHESRFLKPIKPLVRVLGLGPAHGRAYVDSRILHEVCCAWTRGGKRSG